MDKGSLVSFVNRLLRQHKLSVVFTGIVIAACVPAAQTKPITPAPTVIAHRSVTIQLAPPTPNLATRRSEAPAALIQSIKSLWAGFDGKVGISVVADKGGWAIDHRGGELMPQQSVSKLWVAIAVFDAIDAGRLRLNDKIKLTSDDLTLFHQPIAKLIDANGYKTTISDLLTRAMAQSDNTANDALMRRVGGPDGVRRIISAKGLGAIRFGPGEKLLQSGTAGLKWKEEYRFARTFQNARAALALDVRRTAFDAYLADPVDGATPAAVGRALVRLKRGDLLSADSTRTLLSIMAASETGKARLRAGVPVGWDFVHKTGTGQDLKGTTAGYNDVGIMTAPDGASYAVVVMISRTSLGVPSRQRLMQAVAAAIAANHTGQNAQAAGPIRAKSAAR